MKKVVFASWPSDGNGTGDAGAAELTGADIPAGLMNASIAQEAKTRAARLGTSSAGQRYDLRGYNPAFAGATTGRSASATVTPRHVGPVEGRHRAGAEHRHRVLGLGSSGSWRLAAGLVADAPLYSSFFIANLPDDQRPWHAIDIGNSISYVINQGPAIRRTTV
jgi:hypothetical protein